MTERYYGCHVSTAGGLENGIKNGASLGVNTIQIHAVPPQQWNSKPAAKGVEDKFLEAKKTSGIKKVFFHGIYLINLASSDPRNLGLSKLSLIHSMDLLNRMKAEGLIFHVGSMKELDEEPGYKQCAEAIDSIMAETSGTGRLLLEVAAGAGSVVGDRLEELRSIFDQLKKPERVGFALDTQHMWASGYNWKENLENIIHEIEKHFGFDRIGAIHLNDSKTEFASKKDRHENLGDGLIGEPALKSVFLHPKLAKIPFILETPAMKKIEEAGAEVEKMRQWLGIKTRKE